MSKSQNIFDNDDFFDGYKALRERPDNANDMVEKPALFAMLPELSGKAVLDLGCGYGENCAHFSRLGAARVVGVDISEKMLAAAVRENPEIDFIRADISDLSFVTDKFDVVTSSLALHYIEDFDTFVKSVYQILNEGGYLIFSTEHPFTTAPISAKGYTKDADGNYLHYNLANYAESGRRTVSWFVDGVVKYHRTFSDVVNAIARAGFVICEMAEPIPSDEMINRDSRLAKKKHKPDFLLVKARKS